MPQPTKTDKRSPAQRQRRVERQARLAAELRSNLHKRKEQARGRALRDAPESARNESEEERRTGGQPSPRGELA